MAAQLREFLVAESSSLIHIVGSREEVLAETSTMSFSSKICSPANPVHPQYYVSV